MPTEINWDIVPSWLSAIVASCALIFTSWTAYNSQRSAKASEKQAQIAVEQQRQRDEQDEHEQASKIAGWVEYSTAPSDDYVQNDARIKFLLKYINASEQPVYSFKARSTVEPTPGVTMTVCPPCKKECEDEIATLEITAFTRLKDEIKNQELPGGFYAVAYELMAEEVCRAGVEIEFTDSKGQIWNRASNGVLSKGPLRDIETSIGANQAKVDDLHHAAVKQALWMKDQLFKRSRQGQ